MSDVSLKPGVGWVRQTQAQSLPAPKNLVGPIAWVRENLFGSILSSVLTLLGIWAVLSIAPPLWKFLVSNATFVGEDRTACLPNHGMCYPYLQANFSFFMYGFYPEALRWRPNLTLALGLVGIVGALWPDFAHRAKFAIFFLVIYPILAFFLLYGTPAIGLEVVPTNQWGGVIVTLVVAITGIVFSLPLGILLALGRRSKLPVIKFFSVLFIEFWRGVPLVTVLFMASLMLPLFVPQAYAPDKLLRALVAVALFSSAYMAEVVRGGLQAIPKGQTEGAQALGLAYWQTMRLVILPQALKLVIPGIVNTFIGLFKDTSLVFIVGLVDFLKAVDMSLVNPNWATPWTRYSGYFFAALFYFVCCWGMSVYSRKMEARLATGHKR
jgi:general L-amino acid transport system permease protein